MPADDGCEPIVGFSAGGTYDPSPANPMGALVSRDLANRVRSARQANAVQKANQALAGTAQTVNKKWIRLEGMADTNTDTAVSRSIANLSDERVAPLIKSEWGQQTVYVNKKPVSCFNYYTPPFNTPGKVSNYPCGCVATAMAQLMCFHQYPTAGVGTASFPITVNNGKPQNANLLGGDEKGGPYEWGNMPEGTPDAPITTTTQCQAIGALTHDVGVAVSMNYTSTGSGANASTASAALKTTFFYSNSIYGYNNGNDIDAGLQDMLNPNLDAGYPILLSIQGYDSTPHEIVCDGYGYDSSSLYYHLNMGWSGAGDAYSNQQPIWYNLPIIDALGGPPFNLVYGVIYNIYVSGFGEIISGRVTDNNGNPLSGATVTAVYSGTSATANTNSNGIYAFAQIPSATSFSISVSIPGYSFAAQTVSTGTSADKNPTSGNIWGVNFSIPQPPVITSVLTAPATEGVAFSYQITASGDPTITFAATNLPEGLNISGDTISGTPTVCGAIAIALTATNVSGLDTESLILNIASGTGISSTPVCNSLTATPQTLIYAGQSVTLSVAASDPGVDLLLYTWDFGDGTTGTGSTVTHTYASSGIYYATVTISNGVNSTTEPVYMYVINLADSNGTFGISKASIKFNFSQNKNNSDSMSLTGTIPVQPGFKALYATFSIYIGGYGSALILNEKGQGRNGFASVSLNDKTTPRKFIFKVNKATLFNSLSGLGFKNTNLPKPVKVNLYVFVGLDDSLYGLADSYFFATIPVTYTAKQNKTGSANFSLPVKRKP